MTTPTNPERLIARVHVDGSGMVCVYAVPQYASPPTQDTWVPYEPSKPSDYIRSDRAAAEMAAQVEINAALHDYSDDITVRICQMAEDLGLKSEPLEVEPDAAEVLSAIHDVLGERDALRRERDALRAVVDAVAAFTAHDFAMSGAHGVMRLVRLAKDAKTAQAGKGVG